MSDAFIVTESAAHKVWELLQDENNFNLKLRVYVSGGGCSGFQYNFSFDDEMKEDDTTVTKTVANTDALVSVVIDPLSFQYLLGAEIDYQEDIEGARFIIRNPNAKTTCGCGSSFGIE